ncbi:hypothetical protein PC120_g23309 [Phytophthora cactorum]|nr:hypothetical protein PC120_g23309 [Phytophthora cactorum]
MRLWRKHQEKRNALIYKSAGEDASGSGTDEGKKLRSCGVSSETPNDGTARNSGGTRNEVVTARKLSVAVRVRRRVGLQAEVVSDGESRYCY